MNAKKFFTFLVLGVLTITVLVVFFISGAAQRETPPAETAPEQELSDQNVQYEGVVTFISSERDLFHVLREGQGLMVVGVPPEKREEISDMSQYDRLVFIGGKNAEVNANLVQLQRVVSMQSGEPLTPEENAALNSEFTGLRL